MQTFKSWVSSGTYLRSIAHDMGKAMGTEGGHLAQLIRTAVREFVLEDAHSLEDLEVAAQAGTLEELCLHPPVRCFRVSGSNVAAGQHRSIEKRRRRKLTRVQQSNYCPSVWRTKGTDRHRKKGGRNAVSAEGGAERELKEDLSEGWPVIINVR